MDNKEKAFVDAATTDLTDDEIKRVFKVVEIVRQRYAGKHNSPENLEALRDEALTRLADINILATMDVAPCFYGDPPELEIIGKLNVDPIHKYGFDHEKKQAQVRKSVERNEAYLGQKENSESAKTKNRDRKSR